LSIGAPGAGGEPGVVGVVPGVVGEPGVGPLGLGEPGVGGVVVDGGTDGEGDGACIGCMLSAGAAALVRSRALPFLPQPNAAAAVIAANRRVDFMNNFLR